MGSVPLVSGEIAEDLTSYFAVSEQIPTACGLGVLVDTDQSVLCAGGYLLQLLPGAPDGIIDALEAAVRELGPVTQALHQGADAAAVLERMPEPAELPAPSAGPGEQEIPDYLLNPDMEPPTVEIDGNDYIGTLDIPCLGLSLPVMSGWSDAQLRTAPCRYAGSPYRSGFVIAGHNYHRHLGPIGRLSPGDRVAFTDVDGNVFAYNVAEIQILKPTAIEDMVSEDWDLSLFTCTLGGRTRLTVRCDRAEAGG